MEEHKNILPNTISDELLMQYMEGKLSSQDARKVEEAMASSEFLTDAEEGLSAIEPQQVNLIVEDLNRNLKSLTQKQNKRLRKIKPLDINWVIVTIIVLAIVATGGYLAIHYMLHHP